MTLDATFLLALISSPHMFLVVGEREGKPQSFPRNFLFFLMVRSRSSGKAVGWQQLGIVLEAFSAAHALRGILIAPSAK